MLCKVGQHSHLKVTYLLVVKHGNVRVVASPDAVPIKFAYRMLNTSSML